MPTKNATLLVGIVNLAVLGVVLWVLSNIRDDQLVIRQFIAKFITEFRRPR